MLKRSSQKIIRPQRGSPERLADALMIRIFRGDFPPGTRLPAERQLARQLGVDRTTLRMALKQLQRMNLLRARHGSGIEVNDFRVTGGLDVLAAMFALEELPLEGSFIVEGLDFWLESFAMTAAKALVRMSLDEMREVERLMDAAIAAGDDVDALIAAELALQDTLARLSGSVLFRMLNNSTRTLRERLMRLLHQTVDDVEEWFRGQRTLLREVAASHPSEEQVYVGLLAALKQLTAGLRQRLLFGAPERAAPRARVAARTRARKGAQR